MALANYNTPMFDRDTAVKVVSASLREILTQNEASIPADLGEATVLVGADAVLDSLGVVALIVDIEERLETEHDTSITLASDKAMSQRNSPFRTVGVLADHICLVKAEGHS